MSFEGSDKQYTDAPQWQDPLGPSWSTDKNGYPILANLPTQAPAERNRMFNEMDANAPAMSQSGQQVAAGLQKAAADPGFAAAQDQARKTINGDYLGGAPQFNQALADFRSGVGKSAQSVRQGAMAGAADTTADLKSQFARAGQGFSTGNQQAAQATKAAGAARANESAAQLERGAQEYETGARLTNYGQERARQTQGAGQLQDATSAPLSYLQAIPQAYMSPLAQQAQLVGGLAGGGPIATPNSTIVRQPGAFDYAMSSVAALQA